MNWRKYMKILCIIGQSQYGSVRRFVLEIAEQMTLCGMQVTILDGTNEREYYKQREQVIQENLVTINKILGSSYLRSNFVGTVKL